jgi:putative transposase
MTIKSDNIKATLKATKERRKAQICRVFELKVDRSALSSDTLSQVRRLFLEAKWFTNACLGTEHPTKFPDNVKEVRVKVKDEFEDRDLQFLSSQMKQGILSRIADSLSALSALKKKGRKVGALKFKPFINSIPLKQFNNTYRIVDNSHIRIQNIHHPTLFF